MTQVFAHKDIQREGERERERDGERERIRYVYVHIYIYIYIYTHIHTHREQSYGFQTHIRGLSMALPHKSSLTLRLTNTTAIDTLGSK